MPDEYCEICERPLNDEQDPTSVEYGGTGICLMCKAELGDPDAIRQMQQYGGI